MNDAQLRRDLAALERTTERARTFGALLQVGCVGLILGLALAALVFFLYAVRRWSQMPEQVGCSHAWEEERR